MRQLTAGKLNKFCSTNLLKARVHNEKLTDSNPAPIPTMDTKFLARRLQTNPTNTHKVDTCYSTAHSYTKNQRPDNKEDVENLPFTFNRNMDSLVLSELEAIPTFNSFDPYRLFKWKSSRADMLEENSQKKIIQIIDLDKAIDKCAKILDNSGKIKSVPEAQNDTESTNLIDFDKIVRSGVETEKQNSFTDRSVETSIDNIKKFTESNEINQLSAKEFLPSHLYNTYSIDFESTRELPEANKTNQTTKNEIQKLKNAVVKHLAQVNELDDLCNKLKLVKLNIMQYKELKKDIVALEKLEHEFANIEERINKINTKIEEDVGSKTEFMDIQSRVEELLNRLDNIEFKITELKTVINQILFKKLDIGKEDIESCQERTTKSLTHVFENKKTFNETDTSSQPISGFDPSKFTGLICPSFGMYTKFSPPVLSSKCPPSTQSSPPTIECPPCNQQCPPPTATCPPPAPKCIIPPVPCPPPKLPCCPKTVKAPNCPPKLANCAPMPRCQPRKCMSAAAICPPRPKECPIVKKCPDKPCPKPVCDGTRPVCDHKCCPPLPSSRKDPCEMPKTNPCDIIKAKKIVYQKKCVCTKTPPVC